MSSEGICAKAFRNLVLVITAAWWVPAHAQNDTGAVVRQLFQQEHWAELAALGPKAHPRTPDLDYYYGVALAHLERWHDARAALLEGYRLAPHDKRFPVELAGVAFQQKNYPQARRYLQYALTLDHEDNYTNEFLATLYFLEGNTEAALQYWNRAGKPEVAAVWNDPPLRVRPALLDRAFIFAPESRLTLDELRASEARVRGLDIFPSYKFDLLAQADGKFNVVFRAQEQNGFGNSRMQAALRMFGGIFFQEITPEYDNARGSATNISSLLRWDPDKRRAAVGISGPLAGDPKWHYRIGADLRNENWTVQTSFTGPSALLGALNMRRESFFAEISRLVGARWSWRASFDISRRDLRNVLDQGALVPPLLSQGYQLKQTAQFSYEIWRPPEKHWNISSDLDAQAGRIWSRPGQSFVRLQGSLALHWAAGSHGNYETQWRVRGGKTFGEIPFDELFMLGVERDNDLWLRAHEGTRHGQKGSAPLGRDYFLSNFESDKKIYSKGLLTVRLGPFFDTGKISDESAALGSHHWLFDTGAQAKVRVFGVGVVLLYGKDVRSGNNTFYAAVLR